MLRAMKTLEYGPGDASTAGPSLSGMSGEGYQGYVNCPPGVLQQSVPRPSLIHLPGTFMRLQRVLSRCIWEAVHISGSLVGKVLAQAQRCWLVARDGIGLSITWTPRGVVQACFTAEGIVFCAHSPAQHVAGGGSACGG